MIIIGMAVVFIALIGAVVGGGPKLEDAEEVVPVDPLSWPIRESGVTHINGYLNENSDETQEFEINDTYVTEATFELNWLDEAPETGPGRYQNQPDTFNFTVKTPWGALISSDEQPNNIGQAGQITEKVSVPEKGIKTSAAMGTWEITIYCINSGDQTPRISIIGIRDIQDPGNAWEMNLVYKFHTNIETEK
jgi:hypothetical protein